MKALFVLVEQGVKPAEASKRVEEILTYLGAIL
jgi:hypothetical protein